ncbi:MAG TPA: type II toxin-antitoxin system RelE/ParE family toxin [Elusimicrobiota bacterium]|jgi:plasmid stabilization system protein ParE|nr:type II toxin-antitoxin system RelE/ParE family toxin [Elusimicrobiota bacterium]
MKLRFLLQAKEDLSAISDPLFSRVLRRLDLLKKFPELGALLPDPHADMRSTVVDNFRIVYRLLANGAIEINYIRDCRRRLPPRA